MPIIDVEVVSANTAHLPKAGALADAIGRVLATPPGRTWVRVRWLDARLYAENESAVAAADFPVFVTVEKAHPPEGEALEKEVAELTKAVAACVGRSPEQVHVLYTAAAAGRQAFGGKLAG